MPSNPESAFRPAPEGAPVPQATGLQTDLAPPPAWAEGSHFQRVSTAMAVHDLEAAHPQDDVAAVHMAMQHSADGHERVLLRAWQLAPAWRLLPAWQRLRRLGWAMWLGVVVAILLAAWGMGAAVMGEGARINLLGALLSLLGLNALMLLLWGLSLFQPAARAGGSASGAGRWWQSPMQWLAHRMGEPTHRLLTGAFGVLVQARGMAWLSGLISHSAWALGFALILLYMGWGFAFRAYQPVLETTILSAGAVQTLLDVLGWLPQWLGMPRPGLEGQVAVAASTATTPAASTTGQWAWWLMACVLGYGLLPRVGLALLCAAVLRHRLRAVRLADDDAGYQRALARFQQLARTRVVDEDHSLAPPVLAVTKTPAKSWALLLHELPGASEDALRRWRQSQAALAGEGDAVWMQPPRWQGSSDGSAGSVRASVQALAALTPEGASAAEVAGAPSAAAPMPSPAMGTEAAHARHADAPALLMAVNGVASPDRGVARFMRALLAQMHGVQLVLWQDAASADDAARAAGRARWQAWLQAEQLPIELIEKDWT